MRRLPPALALLPVALGLWGFLPQAAAAQDRPVTQLWQDPVPVKREPPVYPRIAANNGQEAWVDLSFTIRADGTVGDVQVLDSSDQRGRFNQAAREALAQWIYQPARMDGWTVPDSHGDCDLIVVGDADTRFILVEHETR